MAASLEQARKLADNHERVRVLYLNTRNQLILDHLVHEGTVDEVMPEKGLVRVLVTIFGRQAPVELEYWQIAKAE